MSLLAKIRAGVRRVCTWPIRGYQRFISPYKPPTCRFDPTCSQYAIQAIEIHGILKGPLLAAWRILRCQPFSEPGPDPVPPHGHWRRSSRIGDPEETNTDGGTSRAPSSNER